MPNLSQSFNQFKLLWMRQKINKDLGKTKKVPLFLFVMKL